MYRIALVLAGCGGDGASRQAPGAPGVDVATPLVESVADWDAFTGRFDSPEHVDVRSRVSGYLDAVNFEGGTNATADPTALFGGGYESWYIDRVSAENPQVVEFELVGKLDLTNLRLPGRQVVEHCPWKYKGTECGYRGVRSFDLQNNPLADGSADDQCAKNLRACELRHPRNGSNGIGPDGSLLPFGGFPGARFQV